jgi:hypothetical protein
VYLSPAAEQAVAWAPRPPARGVPAADGSPELAGRVGSAELAGRKGLSAPEWWSAAPAAQRMVAMSSVERIGRAVRRMERPAGAEMPVERGVPESKRQQDEPAGWKPSWVVPGADGSGGAEQLAP